MTDSHPVLMMSVNVGTLRRITYLCSLGGGLRLDGHLLWEHTKPYQKKSKDVILDSQISHRIE